jgi:hypothetical protein
VPIDERAKEILESLVARIDMDDYVARVEAGIRDMPEYQGFVDGRAELDDRGRAGIRWNLEIFHRWARDRRPLPREDRERLRELVGARAAEGRRPEEGLAVYRRAMRAGWEVMLEAADERERAALGGAFDLLLEWIDVVSRVFEETYAEERDARVSQQERRARWLFERITLEADAGPDDQRLADNLGFRLAGAYRPVAALLHGASAAQHLRLAGLLREQGALAVSEGTQVVALAHETVDADGLGFRGRLAVCEEEAVAGAALGDVLRDLRTVAAMALAAGRRGRIDPDRYIPELLLSRSPRLGRRLESRAFGPLLAADREDLVRALELLAANGFERSATASALPVHRNTLVQWIARIQDLTGLNVDDPDDRVTIWLAARARAAGDVHGAQPSP